MSKGPYSGLTADQVDVLVSLRIKEKLDVATSRKYLEAAGWNIERARKNIRQERSISALSVVFNEKD